MADAAQWKSALDEAAYDELYSTARKGMLSAGRNLLAMTDGANILRKAGAEATKLLTSDHYIDPRDGYSKLDLGAACALADAQKKYEPIAHAAANTRPLAHALGQLRAIHKRARHK